LNVLPLFSVLVVLMIIYCGKGLVKSVWCPGGFLSLSGQNFL
jgi:hypothetical protein